MSAVFGGGGSSGALGTGQEDIQGYNIDPTAFSDPNENEDRAIDANGMNAANARAAPTMENTKVGPTAYASGAQVGPIAQSAGASAGPAATGNLTTYNAATVNQTDDNQSRAQQEALANALTAQAAGQGVGQNLAAAAYKQSNDQSMRNLMASTAAAGGSVNPALAAKQALTTQAGVEAQNAQQLSSDKMNASLAAQQQLGTLADQTRSQDQSVAANIASLQQQAAAGNANAANSLSQYNASQINSANQFNANLQQQNNQFNTGNTVGATMQNAANQQAVNLSNQGASNATTALQAQTNLATKQANLEAQLKQTGMNDAQAQAYAAQMIQQDENDQAAQEAEQQLQVENKLGTDKLQQAAYQSAAQAKSGLVSGIAKAAGMAVGLSDFRTKTNIISMSDGNQKTDVKPVTPTPNTQAQTDWDKRMDAMKLQNRKSMDEGSNQMQLGSALGDALGRGFVKATGFNPTPRPLTPAVGAPGGPDVGGAMPAPMTVNPDVATINNGQMGDLSAVAATPIATTGVPFSGDSMPDAEAMSDEDMKTNIAPTMTMSPIDQKTNITPVASTNGTTFSTSASTLANALNSLTNAKTSIATDPNAAAATAAVTPDPAASTATADPVATTGSSMDGTTGATDLSSPNPAAAAIPASTVRDDATLLGYNTGDSQDSGSVGASQAPTTDADGDTGYRSLAQRQDYIGNMTRSQAPDVPRYGDAAETGQPSYQPYVPTTPVTATAPGPDPSSQLNYSMSVQQAYGDQVNTMAAQLAALQKQLAQEQAAAAAPPPAAPVVAAAPVADTMVAPAATPAFNSSQLAAQAAAAAAAHEQAEQSARDQWAAYDQAMKDYGSGVGTDLRNGDGTQTPPPVKPTVPRPISTVAVAPTTAASSATQYVAPNNLVSTVSPFAEPSNYNHLLSTSDKRQKEKIKSGELNDEIMKDFLSKLKAYTYDYKDPNLEGAGHGRQMGVMAQDLEKSEIGKSAVKEVNGIKMVDYGKLGGIQMAGLSMEHDRNNDQDERIKSLEKALKMARGR